MYKKLLAEGRAGGDGGDEEGGGLGARPGSGRGMGGPGRGRGGKAPEDDSLKSDFKPEESKTAMQAGKILMQWKTKEVSEPGQAAQDYRPLVKAVKEGVSEAILQEQVPPGYHQAIQKYFDTLEEPGPASPAKKE